MRTNTPMKGTMMKTFMTILATAVATTGALGVVGIIVDLRKENADLKEKLDMYRTDTKLAKKGLRRALDALHDHDPAEAHRIHRYLVNEIKFRNVVRGF